ncbi:serine hydrolase [Flavobacterium sp. J27]|uniref:serine hydrolase domain-containing protein n=1 Tax=Flavobacterium sp. J27 TaxID=2060419 RepID=UPI00102FF61A|nr:serine hydrolase domain-containing protein [Flavobacterium sp. J27]
MFQSLLFPLFFTFFGNPNSDTINTYLENLHKEGKLNGNVLVIKNNKTVYEKSFGYTDGTKTKLLNNKYSFNVGSVYKEFPAVAIMQLEEQNQLKVDDKIAQYIPNLPKWSEEITIKNLLQYSSGLPLINWNRFFSQGINVNYDDVFNDLQQLDSLQFQPGTNYLYSNNNPILLIKIIENVSKMSYENYLQKNIFKPYHFKNIKLNEQFPFSRKSEIALPFDANYKEDNYKIAIKNIILTATARDLADWFKKLDSYEIISQKSVQLLSEIAIFGDNIQSPLGSCEWSKNKIISHMHHGSSGNYECIAKRYKQDDITIVILTNQKNGNVHDIADFIYQNLTHDN